MDSTSNAILNLAVGSSSSWYHKGQQALFDSLMNVDERARLYFVRKEASSETPYQDKVRHIHSYGPASQMFLWLDCSITAVRQLDDIWAHIEEHGVYLYQSGGNCSETCNDHCLNSYGITRDQAEKIPECASNVVGVNLTHPKGKKFFELWMHSLSRGSNFGHKWPTEEERLEESTDPRFKYHRQDQSSASLAAHLAGVKLEPEGHYVCRHENLGHHQNDSIIFVLKGGVGE